jgi:hypothetical protein
MSQSAATSTWISETVLIASAPVAAYLLTLSYIAGYAGYFNIPTDFISLGITTLFSIGGRVLFLVTLTLLIFVSLFMFWPHSDSPILWRVKRIFPFGVLFIIQLLFFEAHWHEWIGTLWVLALLAAQFFLVPLIGRGNIPTYTKKLMDFDTRQSGTHPTVAEYFFRSGIGSRAATVALWTWFSLSISYSGGRWEAMWHTDYLIPASSPDNVVLSSFGDNMIVAPFDRKTKEVERSFMILKKAEDSTLLLRWEAVGPLHLKDQFTAH